MKLKAPQPPFKTHSWIDTPNFPFTKCSKCGMFGEKGPDGIIYKMFISQPFQLSKPIMSA